MVEKGKPLETSVRLKSPTSVPVMTMAQTGGAQSSMGRMNRESALVERARLGDGQSFRVIFDLYAPPLRRFLRDLLGDEAAADEATQETFVRAHHGLQSMREVEKLAPWLFGIA